MTDEVHNTSERIENFMKRHSNRSSDVLHELNQYLKIQLPTPGNEHHFRFLNNLKKLRDVNREKDFPIDFQELEKEDVKTLLAWIESTEWQDGDVTVKTKNKYRNVVKKLLEMQDKEWEEMTPGKVKVYQNPEDNKTDPSKVPNPREIAAILRNVENRSKNKTSLRNAAFFTTLWDTGARVGALIRIKKEAVTVHDHTVTVRVPGIKDSETREVECFFAAPILKRWLENHPRGETDYLFCNMRQSAGDMVKYENFRRLIVEVFEELENDEVIDIAWKGQPLHIFRKSMKTWFDNMDILSESDLDVRAGHVHGSEATRIYTRKSDEDANRSLRKNLDLEDDEEVDWMQYMEPKRCEGCDCLNVGYRSHCFSCGALVGMEDLAYPDGVKTSSESENVEDQISAIKSQIQELEGELDERE